MGTAIACPRCSGLLTICCDKVYQCLCCGMRFANLVSIKIHKAVLWTQHNFNALHVYCQLIKLKVPKVWAKRIITNYQKIVHPILYR